MRIPPRDSTIANVITGVYLLPKLITHDVREVNRRKQIEQINKYVESVASLPFSEIMTDRQTNQPQTDIRFIGKLH